VWKLKEKSKREAKKEKAGKEQRGGEKGKNSVSFSPQANYFDLAANVGRQS
jgi:hypothetical protein